MIRRKSFYSCRSYPRLRKAPRLEKSIRRAIPKSAGCGQCAVRNSQGRSTLLGRAGHPPHISYWATAIQARVRSPSNMLCAGPYFRCELRNSSLDKIPPARFRGIVNRKNRWHAIVDRLDFAQLFMRFRRTARDLTAKPATLVCKFHRMRVKRSIRPCARDPLRDQGSNSS